MEIFNTFAYSINDFLVLLRVDFGFLLEFSFSVERFVLNLREELSATLEEEEPQGAVEDVDHVPGLMVIVIM